MVEWSNVSARLPMLVEVVGSNLTVSNSLLDGLTG